MKQSYNVTVVFRADFVLNFVINFLIEHTSKGQLAEYVRKEIVESATLIIYNNSFLCITNTILSTKIS